MPNKLLPHPICCDIFCVVVDNYGDAGVCWRLARQLAVEYGWQVRLFIDNPAPLDLLAPDHFQSPVAVAPWPCDMSPDESAGSALSESGFKPPVDVVIEAFACELPTTYIAAMARREKKPVWLNLEYLSAEGWVGEMHGLPSPHPSLPLVKHFFFPGFDERTGGLLREADYDARRLAFDATAFRTEFGLPKTVPHELTLSLFSYPAAPVAPLMQALASSKHPILLLLPGSNAAPFTQGALSTHPLPFLPQARYDELLWFCDLNFVRGEDSFVRAQWAGKPFVWQIYPQADDVHRIKLDALLTRSRHKVGAGEATALQGGRAKDALFAVADGDTANDAAITAMNSFWHAWNGIGPLDWPAYAAALPALANSASRWPASLAKHRDLASNLVQFCLERLK
jgi:uncharacterized repeat protein (TIGR03837 family)